MNARPPLSLDDVDLLQRAARRYQALASGEDSIIWVVDPHLRPTGTNENWERYTGQQPAEYGGLGWMAAVHPEDRVRLREDAARALESGRPLTIELWIRRADGVYRRNLIRAVPVRHDNVIVEWIGTATDIEDARQTADKLAITLAEQRDLRARLFALTEGAEGLLGTRMEEEARAGVVELAQRVLPADAYAVWSFNPGTREWSIVHSSGLSEAFTSQRVPGEPVKFTEPRAFHDLASLPEERRLVYEAEGIRSLLTVPLPIRGERRASLVMCYRQTHRTSESELRVGIALGQLAATALGNVESYVEQTKMRAEAESANRAKDEFLALLSHELRTPLNAIMGWAHMLRDGLPEQTARHAIEVISRNARSQKQLVEDLLDVARIAGGKIDLEPSALDLRDVGRAAVDAALPAARQKNIDLSLSASAERVPTLGDSHRLHQVSANLLSNALKFTEPGGHVRVVVSGTDTYAELAVEDTGTGIEAEFLPFIFERFRQADASLTRTHGGLGLGLWVVRQIVDAHGGTVHAESAGLGKGATIRVQLPISVERRKDIEHRTQNTERRTSKTGVQRSFGSRADFLFSRRALTVFRDAVKIATSSFASRRRSDVA